MNAVWKVNLIVFLFGIIFGGMATCTLKAQEHQHIDGSYITKQDGEFVRTWMRRDIPNSSCCSFHDCWPSEVRFRDGRVFARHIPRGTGLPYGPWLEIPPAKMEQNYPDPREAPSGLNYMCAIGTSVLCFTQGTLG